MALKITIGKEVAEQVARHGEATYPEECCGFLFGHEDAGRFISLAVQVENRRDDNRQKTFEISPLDYLEAERIALKNNLTLVGIYHSHPDHPPIASATDLAKALPCFSYLIVSVRNGKAAGFQSWRLREDERKFEEEEIKLLNAQPLFKSYFFI